MAALFWSSAGPSRAEAADPPVTTAPADSARHREVAAADTVKRRSPPFRVMLRSAVLPGWGQMYNGKPLKAAVVVAGEGLLIYKALEELGKENDAVDEASQFAPGTPEYEQAISEKERHYNLKVNYIWWAVAVHLLQMADAYVDAHLRDFSAELPPGAGAPAGGADLGLTVAARVRF